MHSIPRTYYILREAPEWRLCLFLLYQSHKKEEKEMNRNWYIWNKSQAWFTHIFTWPEIAYLEKRNIIKSQENVMNQSQRDFTWGLYKVLIFFFFKAKKLPRKTRWAKGSPATMTITIATVSQLATFDGSVQKPQTLKAAQEGNLLVQECCPFYQWGRGHLSGKATDKRQQTFTYIGSLQKLLLLTTYYTSEIDS